MNDERIGGFLDREGDEEARVELAKNLEFNTGAAMRLRIFKKADELLRRALPPSTSASDHALAQRILNAEPIRRLEPLRVVRFLAPLAAACLVGVFVGGFYANNAPRFSLRHLDNEVQASLENAQSGEARRTSDGDVMIAMSMRTTSGNYCRQFRVSSASEATDAIACRDNAEWRIVVAIAAPHDVDAAYHLAEGGQGSLEAAIRAVGGATLLNEAEEQALLRSHWQAP